MPERRGGFHSSDFTGGDEGVEQLVQHWLVALRGEAHLFKDLVRAHPRPRVENGHYGGFCDGGIAHPRDVGCQEERKWGVLEA